MNIDAMTAYYTNPCDEKFFARYFLPTNPRTPKALLVVAHGLGEHSGRYVRMGEYFASRGYAVVVYDLRGHGQSVGRRGHVRRFEQWVDDLRQCMMHARRAAPKGTPTYVIGHSLGGLIALNYLAHHQGEIDGAVISAPALSPTVKIPSWKVWLGKRVSRMVPKLHIGNEINPDNLSRDPTVVAAYRDDPHVFKRVTVRAGDEILRNAADAVSLAEHISCPILMIQGNDDRICSIAATKNFFIRIPSDHKRFKVYEGAFHEAFNDVICDKVFADVEDWIDSARQVHVQEFLR